MSVYIIATLDTKGAEAAWVRERLQALGVETRLIDAGCLGTSTVAADVSRQEVFAAAGADLAAVVAAGDRGAAVDLAAAGTTRLLTDLHAQGQVTGALGLGGSAGTTIASAAMRSLPLGVPKLIVSTLASGQTRQFVGDRDILLLNAVVDLAGINRISRVVLDEAVRAMAGMVRLPRATVECRDRPLIAASMFGVTTLCIEQARQVLEQAGYEVLVFHATGNGGQAMESLIAEGLIVGVLDITTTELADETVGGMLSAGPSRLTAAGKQGVPQVVSVGATDMVNFYAPDTVPERFRDRRFYRHNANVTLMRTTAEENERIGMDISTKVAAAHGPVVVLLPTRGVSAIDRAGQPFDDPEARRALFAAIRAHAGRASVIEVDAHINDTEFAQRAAQELLRLLS